MFDKYTILNTKSYCIDTLFVSCWFSDMAWSGDAVDTTDERW